MAGPAGSTLSFHTSAIRPITGPTGGAGNPPVGAAGSAGPDGVCGATGITGLTGITGMNLLGTFVDSDGYFGLRFGFQGRDDLEEVIAVPRGVFTGPAGNVVGSTAWISNTEAGLTSINKPKE